MDPHQMLAAMYVQQRINDLATSALPDAPVLPVTHRRRRIRRLLAAVLARRPVAAGLGRRAAHGASRAGSLPTPAQRNVLKPPAPTRMGGWPK